MSVLIGEISGSRNVVSEGSSLLRRDVLSLRAISDVSNEMLFFIDLLILEDEGTTCLGTPGTAQPATMSHIPDTCILNHQQFFLVSFMKIFRKKQNGSRNSPLFCTDAPITKAKSPPSMTSHAERAVLTL
jgi:hypothetical protein